MIFSIRVYLVMAQGRGTMTVDPAAWAHRLSVVAVVRSCRLDRHRKTMLSAWAILLPRYFHPHV